MTGTASPLLSLSVNGEPYTAPPGTTIAALVERLGLAGRKIAVARNGEVAPRSTHAAQQLAHGDEIEILEAVGGG